ncbi:Bgt-20622 [Blumeria graminis f. sp. tritici]|uniref:Bgt-20622 n=2 Tax=Blumeria graminis f. sp. tritici TaxID=62690 RepID=A0A9X9MF38_BLUGR|nr:Bgt-20622 [Blumeria graminis f. sp. tritici]
MQTSSATQHPASDLDAHGDTKMSGINGINISTLTAIINALNSQNEEKDKVRGKYKHNKPPAPWRSPEEFATLRAAGKCMRCGETGHWFKKCPRFTRAKRPASINATASGKSNPQGSIEIRFDRSEESDSGNE